ncbi:adenosylcobinamide kinase /adenosylcobinamide-phosphate guanylyltransferase [Pseudobutyrivibrio sp. JW11]|uniref:bifunctional adenosylcobinamide kinase/adenosylcobinamide-phosphate guanylyltransferase n=1 Tax=Pseudobutyrivibrio sp. JW11 TaxID=1855302 RepID=UPI0008EABB4B|nr:bifunctional adenosylcobinamide kinase/adenosylcobinamide-phosphate guanylyltransferase [Pseudobutyrivibrio sp. JW11]SFO41490.1 adenosylcobinamide kinase /adenosylcobinamide-phosphate guanylyltransferase [Pseudobutyrivibrio sp. JW11]
MITLVYGGSSSGKSEYAENLVCSTGYKNKYYLATMKHSDDAKDRIMRHRNLRQGKGFVTLEHDVDIVNAISEIDSIDSGDFSTNKADLDGEIVLLECMSNLVANEMFRDGEINSADACVAKILSDVKELEECVSSLVIVTNNVFEDGISYDVGTKEYLRALGAINRKLAAVAEEVYEVVVGIGIRL